MSEVVPDIKEAVSLVRNRRTDAMFVAAYIAVGVLVYIVVYEEKIGEFAQGVLAMVIGMFVNELKSMYAYETGTTRASENKGAAIARIAEQSNPSSAAAVAATVAATMAATTGAPPLPVVPVVQPIDGKP